MMYVYHQETYTFMIDNQTIVRIAQKIKAARLNKNLTIQEVATRSNVTKGLLSKIENSRTIPSLPVFVTLIQSLDISLKEFFDDMIHFNGKDYLLIKKNQHIKISREKRPGFDYRHILSQNIPSCTMEIALLTVEPGANKKPTTTDGYEFKYVLQGTCEYHLNNEVIELEEGDSIYFDASRPHVPVNKSSNNVVMLVVYFIVSK